MKPIWIARAIDAFARASKLDFDAIRLRKEQEALLAAANPKLPPAAFLLQLNEACRSMQLTFFENEVTEQELSRLVDESLLPMLVFRRPPSENRIQPLVVLSVHRKVAQMLDLETEESLSLPVNELYESLLSYAALNTYTESDGMLPEKPEAGSKRYFLTALAVHSLVTPRDPEVQFTPWQRLWHLLSSERKDIFYIYVYAIAIGILSLTLPLGIQAIMGLVSGGLILNPVILLIGFVILGTALSGVLMILQAHIVETLQQRVFARASFELALRIPRLKLEALRPYYPPELLNRFFDVLNIQKGFKKLLLELITAVLQILFGLLLLTFYHPYFIFFSVVLVAILILIFYLTGKKGLQASLEESKYKYRVAHWTEELARNHPTFHLAPDSRLPVDKMDYLVGSYLQKRKKKFAVLVAQYGAMFAFKTAVTGGLLILGSVLVVNRQITLGQFVASEIVIVTILASIEKIFLALDTIYDLLTAVEKVGQVTDLPVVMPHGGNLQADNGANAYQLSVKDLTVADDPTLLNQVTFTLEPGKRLGILADDTRTGDRLVQAILGMEERCKGVVSYNNFHLRDLNLANLQSSIGHLLRSDDIFEGTVEENIAIGRHNLSTLQVLQAARQAGLQPWLEQQADGIQTEMMATGRGIDPATRSRILLARALAEQPRMMIVQDTFGNLSRPVRNELYKQMTAGPWSFLAYSRDPDLLRQLDQIVVIVKGRIIQQGHPSQLLEQAEVQALLNHPLTSTQQ